MKRFLTVLLAICFLGFASMGIYSGRDVQFKQTKADIELQDNLTTLNEVKLEKVKLNTQMDKLLEAKDLDAKKIQEIEQQKIDSEKRIRELEQEVSLKKQRDAEAANIASVGISEKASAASAPAWNGQCGDNAYANSIYMQESGCRLDALNSIGACGIGQALPCEKMSSVCPNWRTDYACQNAWFTQYAMQYGGWKEAHDFKYCVGTCWSNRTQMYNEKTIYNRWY